MAVTVLGCAAVAPLPAVAWAAGPQLVPYKAVYDLSLLKSSGPNEVETARGRLVAEFSGDACKGYAVKVRQFTILAGGEGVPRMMDAYSSTFEKGEGRSFRFRTATAYGERPATVVDGDADLDGKALVVRLKTPQDTRDVGPEALFPTEHTRRLIEAAEAGQHLFSARVFDGTGDGRKVYDTLAVIGPRIAPGQGVVEPAARRAGLGRMARWPVRISYFTPGTGERLPVYSTSFELFANGVNGSLRMEYPTFSLKGEMRQLTLSAATHCKR